MTVRLSGTGVEIRNPSHQGSRLVVRLSDQTERPKALRETEAFIVRDNCIPDGFGSYVVFRSNAATLDRLAPEATAIVLPDDFDYLAGGDVIRVHGDARTARVLYRRNSPHNTFLTTERCNNYCLMCSQPPKNVDDSWIVDDILKTIPLIDPNTPELIFSGGEPTLLGDSLLRILRMTHSYLPRTAVHILSNGRRFSDIEFARKYSGIGHPDMMVGIPVYSDLSTVHDYVVQADGAFDETIRGIVNLKQFGQPVEIRVVIHRQTYARLPQLAEFITRNLTFVDHVALMGLEMTGFTKANLEDLWIDPIAYQAELDRATKLLAYHGMNVSIYNHQLCLLDRSLWAYAKKSISDWKNEYMPECKGCSEMNACGGFFASAKLRYSAHIRPFA